MYSASPISMTDPPVSWLPSCIACFRSASVTPKARSLSGSTTTWYWRTMPPIVATSATPGTVCSSYFRNQSCRLRSWRDRADRCGRRARTRKPSQRPSHPVPAKTGRRRAARRHLAQVLEHSRARPVQIRAVLEDDVDIGVAEEGVPAHRDRFRHGQHRRRQRIRHLVLHHLRCLPGKRGLDDDLHVGEIRQGIDRRFLDRPDTDSSDDQCHDHDQESIRDRPANERSDHCADSRRSSAESMFDSESIRNCAE